MRWFGCIVALAGCDRVFGLEPVPDARIDALIDAAPGFRYIGPGDYDGDGEDNAVDPCPLLAHEDPRDDDGDGLPNVCDPDLNQGGTLPDCIVLLDGFNDAVRTLDPKWRTSPGWVDGLCDGGAPSLCSPEPGSGLATVYFDAAFETARVEVELRAHTVEPTTSATIQLLSDYTPGTDVSGRACGIVHSTGTDLQLSVRDLANGGVIDAFTNGTGYTLAPSDDVELRWTPQRACRIVIPVDQTALATIDTVPKSKTIGLRVFDAQIALHYIIAYGSSCR